jgi:hypothetical protein
MNFNDDYFKKAAATTSTTRFVYKRFAAVFSFLDVGPHCIHNMQFLVGHKATFNNVVDSPFPQRRRFQTSK